MAAAAAVMMSSPLGGDGGGGVVGAANSDKMPEWRCVVVPAAVERRQRHVVARAVPFVVVK